jgi:hypothetical protein
MPVDVTNRRIVEELCQAMQIGPAAEDTLVGLFTDDATLIEPFTGQNQTHTGKTAIRGSLKIMWQNRAPDLRLTVDRIDMDGASIRAEWTCTSMLLAGPMHGYDLLDVRDGKIGRLEIVITEMPAFAPPRE